MDQEEIAYIKAISLFIETRLVRLENDVTNLWESIHHYERLNQEMCVTKEALEQDLAAKQAELEIIKTSRMFKLFQFLRKVKGFFFRQRTH